MAAPHHMDAVSRVRTLAPALIGLHLAAQPTCRISIGGVCGQLATTGLALY